MHVIDYTLVVLYLVGLLVCGCWLARRAGRSDDDYFLGGRRLPWWSLGASGMSSNLDAAGTMTLVTLIYLYGLHGFFMEMRGGIVLPIAVFLAFMGKWHQRSGVTTTAEWMRLRFGSGPGGQLARTVAALTYLVITVGMVVFFLAAAGRFLAVFLPFSPTACAIGMALIALTYTAMSGLYGVVWTDVFQAALIAFAAIYVGVMAWLVISPEVLAAWPGADWNTVLPVWSDPALGEYSLFMLFLLAWAGKGLLEGLGGSGGSAYMAQRFYAAPSAAACQRIGMLWTILFAFRWPMVLGFVVLAVSLGLGEENPETLLPEVLQSGYFPAGLRGLIVAAIFAASMSTFDSTINAGASYVVKDLYEPWVKSTARQRVIVGYLASIGIVAVGLVIALVAVESILAVWVMIVIQLFPAFLVPFALRWYWGQFNGVGFSVGIIAGFAAAFGVPLFGLDLNEVQTLLVTGLLSTLGCLIGNRLGAPVPESVQRTFFDQIRPFGLWPKAWKAPHREEHRRDGLRLATALIWQLCTFMLPMLAILKKYPALAVMAVLWLGLTIILLRLQENEEALDKTA